MLLCNIQNASIPVATPPATASTRHRKHLAHELCSCQRLGQVAQVLVETAMVSACGGLAFALSSLLKLSSYEAFIMPLPVLLCAVRNGGKAGRKAVRATFVLLAGKPGLP